jgi:glycosyltransferase involved in cell wall biosynthesis
MSSSPYIAFLDADDYWLPERLERQVAILKRNPGVGLICSDCATWQDGEAAGSFFANSPVPQTGKLFERLVRGCFIFTPTVLVRRECLEEVGPFNESLITSEDFNLWLRIAARSEIAVVPEALAVREICPTGLSRSTKPDIYLQNAIAALEDVKLVSGGLSSGESRALEKAIAERYYVYGSFLLASGLRGESRKQLSNAIRRRPADWRAWIKMGLSCLPGSMFREVMEMRSRFV